MIESVAQVIDSILPIIRSCLVFGKALNIRSRELSIKDTKKPCTKKDNMSTSWLDRDMTMVLW